MDVSQNSETVELGDTAQPASLKVGKTESRAAKSSGIFNVLHALLSPWFLLHYESYKRLRSLHLSNG